MNPPLFPQGSFLAKALWESSQTVIGAQSSGRLLFWNRTFQQRCGWTEADLRMEGAGAACAHSALGADWDRFFTAHSPVAEAGETSFTCLLVCRNGPSLRYRFRVFSHRDPQLGEVWIFQGDAEERPDAVNLYSITADLMLGSIAHELNNQFSLIGHTAELVPLLSDPDKQAVLWNRIFGYCEQGRKLVGRLRAHGNRLLDSPVEMDLVELVRRTVVIVQGRLPDTVVFRPVESCGLAKVYGSEMVFEEILIRVLFILATWTGSVPAEIGVQLTQDSADSGHTVRKQETAGVRVRVAARGAALRDLAPMDMRQRTQTMSMIAADYADMQGRLEIIPGGIAAVIIYAPPEQAVT